jgi:hypothetical protein
MLRTWQSKSEKFRLAAANVACHVDFLFPNLDRGTAILIGVAFWFNLTAESE